MKCPNCGAEGNGAFCAECGTPLRAAACAECGARLPAGARFCTQCGTPVGPRRSRIGWWVAGAAMLALILVLVVPPLLRDEDPRRIQTLPTRSFGGMQTPPALSGSMRENADRLFNRVLAAASAGDSAEARRFAPMGVQAYQAAGELDADARYHMSLLQNIAGDARGARATAEQVLATDPRHLLALAAAAEAARSAGDTPAMRDYWRRFLESWDEERTRALPEYADHEPILPEYRDAAAAAVGG